MNQTVGHQSWSVTDDQVTCQGRVVDLSTDRIRLVGGCSGLAPLHLHLVVNGTALTLTEPNHGLLGPPDLLAALASALDTIGAEPHRAIADQLSRLATQGVLSLVTPAAPTPGRPHLRQDDPVDALAAIDLTDARIAMTIAGDLVIRPVLIAVTPDGRSTIIDLAHPTTGSVQPAERLAALAALVETVDTAEAALVAHQIRELAGWERIDERYDLTIDIGTGPTPRQPLPEADRLLKNREPLYITTPQQATRHRARMVLLPILALVILAAAWTCETLTGDYRATDLRRTGTALVTACHTDGPISRHGLGYLTTCTVEITWSDGTTQARSAGDSAFSDDDIGSQVGVGELRTGCLTGCHLAVVRWPKQDNGWYGLACVILVVLALVALSAAYDSGRALRHWRRYRARGRPTRPDPAPGPSASIHLNALYLAARRETAIIRANLAAELRPDVGTVTFPSEYPIYLADAHLRLIARVPPASQAGITLELDGQALDLIDPIDGHPREPEELAALAEAIRATGTADHHRVADLIDALRQRGILGLLPGDQHPTITITLADTDHDDADRDDTRARRRYQATIWLGGLRLYIAVALTALAADGCWQIYRIAHLDRQVDLTAVRILPLALWLGWKFTRATVRRIQRMRTPASIDGDHIRHQGRWRALSTSTCHVTLIGGPRRRLGWSGPWPILPALMVDPGTGPMITVPLADPATGLISPPTELTRLANLLTNQPTAARDLYELTHWRHLPTLSDSTLIELTAQPAPASTTQPRTGGPSR